jgi:serine/threonine protein kinase
LGGELDPDEALRIDGHTAGCTPCRDLLAELAALEAHSTSATVALPRRSERWLPAGTAVGRYLVLAAVGVGAMGVVYEAYDPKLDRKVALKLVRLDAPEGLRREAAQERLLKEARAIARVSHPNVVAVFDAGTYEDRVFVAMELVGGTTLTEWMLERQRTVAELLPVFVAAGRGLAAAHLAGIVHRASSRTTSCSTPKVG